jgi:hypothetical protein
MYKRQTLNERGVIKFFHFQIFCHFVLGFCGSSAIDDEDAIIGYTMDNVNPDGSNPALMG